MQENSKVIRLDYLGKTRRNISILKKSGFFLKFSLYSLEKGMELWHYEAICIQKWDSIQNKICIQY